MSFHFTRRECKSAFRTLRTSAALVLVSGLFAQAALAQQSLTTDLSQARSIYVQGSWANRGTHAATVGVTMPWSGWSYDLWGGRVRGLWDIYATRLSFDGARGYDDTWMFGLTPTLRWRADNGSAPWFVEAGIGLSYMTDRYITVHKEFSTSFNFASHLGVGYNFGDQRRHEVQLRLEHVSNAGIKHPNPGENFAQLRYGYHF